MRVAGSSLDGVQEGHRDLPAGVIFDCDGTLADTETLSARVWRDVLARRGIEVTAADHAAIIGRAWPAGFDHFSARGDLGDVDSFRAELREQAGATFDAELRLFPDVVATLRAFVAEGVPVAVASSSTRSHVSRCLDREDLRDLVTAIVGADDVEDHKPDPAPYLAAAAALGVPASRCTAVEDTPIGLASARAAGTYTVAIVRGVFEPSQLDDADLVVDEITPAALVPPAAWVSPAA
ncbi:MAG: HAD family phosphatase [Nitriliruptor sp.]|uniref:HAD family hydrolase n=1 Tax=Nitriliruptor sp. TaxID=2448056 RepID=UPI0034A04EF3